MSTSAPPGRHRGLPLRNAAASGRPYDERSEIGSQKKAGSLDHASEHLAEMPGEGRKFDVLLGGDVTTVLCKVQRRISFTVLPRRNPLAC